MNAPDQVGLAADAEALNLADEIRRILADGEPRTTREVAAVSRLTKGDDDVSKTIYLLRMRGELSTDVVDGQRLHRLIPGGGPAPREPAVPVGARLRRANIARRSRAPTGADQPPRAASPAAPPPTAADDLIVSINDQGQLVVAQPGYTLTLTTRSVSMRRLVEALRLLDAVFGRPEAPA